MVRRIVGGGNQKIVADINKRLVLRAISEYPGVSRIQLAEMTGLTSAAITGIVKALLHEKLIVESADKATDHHELTGRGRRPIGLQINPIFGYTIGLELTDKRITGILMDFAGRTLFSETFKVKMKTDRKEFLTLLFSAINCLIEKAGMKRDRLQCICVAPHGILDRHKGISVMFPSVEDWENVPLEDILAEEFAVPVIIETRMYVATLMELTQGVGRDTKDFIYFNAGPGVAFAIGIVSDGKILRGVSDLAGQIGHLVVVDDGDMCYCGSRGCLATVASPEAIARQACSLLAAGIESSIGRKNYDGIEEVTFECVVRAAKDGDKVALSLLEQAGEMLGKGLSYVINLLNPSVAILAGEFVQAGDIILPAIERAVRTRTVAKVFQNVHFKASALPTDAVAIGAALLARGRFFEVPQLGLPDLHGSGVYMGC